MTKLYIENGNVTVEANGEKKCYAGFVEAAETLGVTNYEAVEAIVEAVEANGVWEA
jgi:hypothetical protein